MHYLEVPPGVDVNAVLDGFGFVRVKRILDGIMRVAVDFEDEESERVVEGLVAEVSMEEL